MQKLETLETKTDKKGTEIKEMDQRLNQAELHTASDKIGFGLELRSRAESIHYTDMRTGGTTGTHLHVYRVGPRGLRKTPPRTMVS